MCCSLLQSKTGAGLLIFWGGGAVQKVNAVDLSVAPERMTCLHILYFFEVHQTVT